MSDEARSAQQERSKRYHQEHTEDIRAGKASHYQRHRAAIDAANQKWMRSRRDFISEQKVGRACARCGITDPCVLDFHYIDPMTKAIQLGRASETKVSKQRILDEIAKCEVLCANCHRILHWEERNGNGGLGALPAPGATGSS